MLLPKTKLCCIILLLPQQRTTFTHQSSNYTEENAVNLFSTWKEIKNQNSGESTATGTKGKSFGRAEKASTIQALWALQAREDSTWTSCCLNWAFCRTGGSRQELRGLCGVMGMDDGQERGGWKLEMWEAKHEQHSEVRHVQVEAKASSSNVKAEPANGSYGLQASLLKTPV